MGGTAIGVIFEYGQTEIEYLKSRDETLGNAIDKIGKIERKVTEDTFKALISIIVSQQISKKAAATIWERLCGLLTEITPQAIANTDEISMQKCGMTLRKAGYIKGIGEAAINGDIDFSSLNAMSDQKIIKTLTMLKGVGIWTAEMLMIFSLSRPDIVSFGDLAIRKGMMNLYNINELTKEKFLKHREVYSPYGSVASLYLWELSGGF